MGNTVMKDAGKEENAFTSDEMARCKSMRKK